MKRSRKIAAALATALALAAPITRHQWPQAVSHADTPEPTALVLKAVDGDTIDVVDDIRKRLRVRLIGLDTPTKQRNRCTRWAVSVRKLVSSPATHYKVNAYR
ncbi:micrococcal nuclease-like nuclease [Mycobacteroides abscessus subsp. abscessus]|nr:micrococcal nuclease-like nuclease [Mycobacteroides abscessus subsp. abscessus]SHR81606.1 micrococcal nuclease-like nuclease [Mycobacteroides abscessus subsp. abscessus]SLL31001.1 micrococcal nuclease-like nuclease [Mycobacteroides abscessus subsp. abscessus]